MAMTAGTVTISADGSASGTGAAGALYNLLLANLGGDIPAGEAGVQSKEGFAKIANTHAEWMVDYLIANLDVRAKIVSGDSGLQRDNTGGNPDTLSPTFDKTLGTKAVVT